MAEKSDLENLKKEFKKIQNKFSLPNFEELNQDFSIEKISEFKTEYLIREVRVFISQKISTYLRFIDTLLNPSDTPAFLYPVLRAITPEDKEKLNKIYKILTKIEFEIIEMDIQFSEEKEAQFIKQKFLEWQEIKKSMLEVFENIKNNWGNKFENNPKDYFG